MTSGFVLIMMLHLVTGNDNRPLLLNLKEVQIPCKDITGKTQKEDYKYMGVLVRGGKEYISKYTDLDLLSAEVDKQCVQKDK